MQIPESQLIKSEITIRKMELPEEIKLTRKSLVRWLALSLGLISANESRMVLIDILDAMVYFHSKKISPTTKELYEHLCKIENVHEKTVYYHLGRLKEMGLIEKCGEGYCFSFSKECTSLSDIIERLYKNKLEDALEKIKTACDVIERSY